jgi:hypothetical protein
MCDCDLDVISIVDELKHHRPIIPAPGWRVFSVLLDTTAPDNVRVNEQHIFGWQATGESGFLQLRAQYRTWKVGDGYILEPYEQFDKKKALSVAVNRAIKDIFASFKELTEAQKDRFRKTFPGVKGDLTTLPLEQLNEVHNWLCYSDEPFADEVGS